MRHLRTVSMKRKPASAQLECTLCRLFSSLESCISKQKCRNEL